MRKVPKRSKGPEVPDMKELLMGSRPLRREVGGRRSLREMKK